MASIDCGFDAHQPIDAVDLRASRKYLYVPLPVHLAATVLDIQGVKYADGQLLFDRAMHTEETATLLLQHVGHERLAVQFQGVGRQVQVTRDDVRTINERHSQIELAADDLVVFEDYAANDLRMRRPLKFRKDYLEAIVPSYVEGRTALLHHRETYPVGATFAAEVVRETVRGIEANWLRVRWYAVTKDASEERRQHIQDAQTGVLRYTSIEARGGTWEFQEVEGPDGAEYFYEISASDDAEGGELSRVYLGAVYGAGDGKVKSAAPPLDDDPITKPQEEIICLF